MVISAFRPDQSRLPMTAGGQRIPGISQNSAGLSGSQLGEISPDAAARPAFDMAPKAHALTPCYAGQ